MKKILIALFSLVVTFGVHADDKVPAPAIQSQQSQPNEAELQSHKHYANKDGQGVHSPSKSKSGDVPGGASARCSDGSYSFSKHHSGTCSHHGGVATWL